MNLKLTSLLVPAALAAGFFSTASQAHDVVVAASVPGLSIVIGNPAPPPVYVYEPAPPPPTYVVYEQAPPPPATYIVYDRYHRPLYTRYVPRPVVIERERPREYSSCGHRGHDEHSHHDARHDNGRRPQVRHARR